MMRSTVVVCVVFVAVVVLVDVVDIVVHLVPDGCLFLMLI